MIRMYRTHKKWKLHKSNNRRHADCRSGLAQITYPRTLVSELMNEDPINNDQIA